MTKTRAAILALALSGAAFAIPANAETLQGALAKAYQANPDLTADRARQRAADEQVPLAKASGRPTLGVSATYTENVVQDTASSGFNFQPDRLINGGAELAVPIYSGGAVRNGIRAAENRVEAGRANLRGTESTIFSQTVAAYMDVIRDEAILGLNAKQVNVLEVNLRAASDRFQIGDLTRTDVAQSEARLAIARGNYETARANLIRSKETYLQLVGTPPVDLETPPALPNLPASPDDAVDVAIDRNPDLIAAREAREAAGFDVRVAEAARLPSVTIGGGPQYSNNLGSIDLGDQGVVAARSSIAGAVSVRATVPIYQGGRPGAQVRQSAANLGAAQEREVAAERAVVAQARAAYASHAASLRVIESSERAVQANELSLEGVRAENSVGNRTILDILNAEQELLNTQVTLVTARRNAYVAGFTLLAAMGRAEARDLGLEGGTLYDPMENYDRVRNSWSDWSSGKAPPVEASRTVDSPAQTADIPAVPVGLTGTEGGQPR